MTMARERQRTNLRNYRERNISYHPILSNICETKTIRIEKVSKSVKIE